MRAAAHQQSTMPTQEPCAIADLLMSMHYQSHTHDLKRKPIWGLTGVDCMAARNAKCIAIVLQIGQHHVRWDPALRCPEPNSRLPYDKQEFVRREIRSPLRVILHRPRSIRHATAHLKGHSCGSLFFRRWKTLQIAEWILLWLLGSLRSLTLFFFLRDFWGLGKVSGCWQRCYPLDA